MAFEIAKAGWLYRQSSVLHRWKHNWFVLYKDGVLKYFDSPDSHVAEEAMLLPAKCNLIKKATQIPNITPPPGHSVQSLLALVFHDQTWTLCAESEDDMTSWVIALEEARVINRTSSSQLPPPPYCTARPPNYSCNAVFPGTVYYGTHPPAYVVQSVPGQQTVVYTDPGHHRYYRRGYDGTDVAMGMVAGAALGSMMWGPMLWW